MQIHKNLYETRSTEWRKVMIDIVTSPLFGLRFVNSYK